MLLRTAEVIRFMNTMAFGRTMKHIDAGCLNNEFLLSSEDTAFHLSLIRQCASLLNVGAVPFSTFASSYNRRFHYSKEGSSEVNGSVGGKRMKR